MGKIESQKDSQISRRYKESRTYSVIQKPHPDDNVTCNNNPLIQSQGLYYLLSSLESSVAMRIKLQLMNTGKN